jgi:hypothetical protein
MCFPVSSLHLSLSRSFPPQTRRPVFLGCLARPPSAGERGPQPGVLYSWCAEHCCHGLPLWSLPRVLLAVAHAQERHADKPAGKPRPGHPLFSPSVPGNHRQSVSRSGGPLRCTGGLDSGASTTCSTCVGSSLFWALYGAWQSALL